jgi:DNA-binding HxlR family transcriptional regulator
MMNIIENLNKVFENRARLGIMSILLVEEWVEFNRFKEILELTDGNLASHLKSLEIKKYIEMKKEFIGRKPKTTYNATNKGKKEFQIHLKNLENLIKNNKF